MVAQIERVEETKVAIETRPAIDPDTEHPWWLRYPKLIVNRSLHIIDQGKKTDHTEAAQVFGAARPMLETIAREFERAGCDTITVPENGEKPTTTNGSHDNSAYSITVNPVYLGALPKKVEQAFTDYALHPNDENLLAVLKKHLPEEKRPLLSGIGNRLLRILHISKSSGQSKQNGLKEKMENGFVNMIFVRDDNDTIAKAPDRAKQLFNWALMAKIGAFKESIHAFRNNNGEIEFSDPILATLEGGHPILDNIGLAQHLMVIGSTKSVGGADEIEGIKPIAKQVWRNSPVVNGLRGLGRFLGEKNLMAPPLAFHQFVRGRRLKHKLIELAEYSRQAEGAFWGWWANKQMVVESAFEVRQTPLTGAAIVTSSGRFGAVKTNLGFKDLVATIPARVLGFAESTKVLFLPVKGHKVRKPSVEAEEITNPAYEHAEENPEKYTLTLKEVEGGYIESVDGDIKVPIPKGEAHLHDEMIIKDGISPNDQKLAEMGVIVNEETGIFQVPTDEFPAFGCGVDHMQEMSKRVMKKAFDIRIKLGRKYKACIFYVPNHGYNAITFWTPDKNGIISANPFSQLEELIENGDLKVTRTVHQRNYYRPLDDYYTRQTKKAA